MKKHALLLLALLLPALPTSAKSMERHYNKSFDVRPGASLLLSHGDGDVTIRPWTEDRIEITVDYRSRATGVFSTTPEFRVDFEQKGNEVRVAEHPARHTGLIVNVRRTTYTYVIQAPAWMEIITDGDDGDVEITGWRAKLELSLDDGDIRLEDIDAPSVSIRMEDGNASLDGISGALDIHCDDGNIEIRAATVSTGRIEFADGRCELTRSAGDFHIRMDDGNVTLSEVRCRRLDIQGQDGRARVELLPVSNPDVSISMDDGDIDLLIPDDLSTEFAALADDGSVTVKLVGAENVRKGRRSVRGILHDGHGSLRLETADGSITLRQLSR